jgi:hypothetical protein
VVDQNDDPAAAARVLVIAASPRAPGVYVATTDADGFISDEQPTVSVSSGETRELSFTGTLPFTIFLPPNDYAIGVGEARGPTDIWAVSTCRYPGSSTEATTPATSLR